eukprot:11270426-Ditylum_brightwellii.AAC.1
MEVTKETLVQLGKEGIKEVKDLVEFNKDIWKQVAENLKPLEDRMKNPYKEADQNHDTVPQILYLFGIRLQKRLLEAYELMRATALISRPASIHRDNFPHDEEFYSIEKELVAQDSNTHPLYREDNAFVYYCLEEAVRGT